jgi:hypothetical protein
MQNQTQIQIQATEEDFKRILDKSLTIGPNSIRPDQINRYKLIRGSNFSYPCKHALLTTDKPGSPWCNSVCNPVLESDAIYCIDDVRKEPFSVMKIYHCMENPTCFRRCGSASPGCDPTGSIDVRLLENKEEEFEPYYVFRPQKLMASDIDKHPESLDIHRAMLKWFPEESELASKIRAVI